MWICLFAKWKHKKKKNVKSGCKIDRKTTASFACINTERIKIISIFFYIPTRCTHYIVRTVAPVCRPGQKTVYSGGRQETIKILCELEANPHNVTFNWKFNASATEFLDLPASQIFPERNNAVASYTPMTEHVSISTHFFSSLFGSLLYRTVANHFTQQTFQWREKSVAFFLLSLENHLDEVFERKSNYLSL